jgi:hypothetical protein
MEIVLDWWLGSRYPGYDWKSQSISYLGQSGSHLLGLVKVWGILFTGFLAIYAIAIRGIYRGKKGTNITFAFLIIYAIGEGLGSAFFPINAPGDSFGLSALMHNVFSSTGDLGLMLFPFCLMKFYRDQYGRSFYQYLWIVVSVGFLMGLFFTIAKYYEPNNFILHYKGVWQRIYTFNYHLMLVMVGIGLYAKSKRD